MSVPSLSIPVSVSLGIAFLLAAAPRAWGETDEFRPNLGPDMSAFTVTCGDLALVLRRHSQWTPARIDFRGHAMSTERSAYGTVFSFPGVGFIGTGHLENEPEDLQSLAFFLDGKAVTPTEEGLAGDRFRFERDSRIRNFRLRNVIELKGGRLHETARISTRKATELALVYHFMHAWLPSVSAFVAGRDDSPDDPLRGELNDDEATDRAFFIKQRVDWVGIYEPESGQFAVSRLLEAPATGEHVSLVWNVPGTYRKYYLKCFANGVVPAGFDGTWRMVTGFGAAPADGWEQEARRLAAQLRE